MTDIEQKALALVNEVRRERGLPSFELYDRTFYTEEALCRAIEQHEAFKLEVSDAVENVRRVVKPLAWDQAIGPLISRFIIAKPDPLVEALNDLLWAYDDNGNAMADQLRAAIEKRGGKIVWGEG